MRKYFPLVCLLAAIIAISSCRNVLKGEGNKTTVSPPVSSFSTLDITLPVNVTINVQTGSQPGIVLSGYENVIKHIKINTDNNTLILKTDLDDNWTIDGRDVTVTITTPTLSALSLEGATDADIHGNISGSNFKLGISGASRAVIDNINTDNFSSDISGAADLRIKSGNVKVASYELSGAGKILAFPLQTSETSTSISGTGTSEVTASQKLTANISGAGTIKYKGHPSISRDVSGAGSISDAN